MKNGFQKFAMVMAVALTFAISASAQTTSVRGKVIDEKGKPVVDGTVEFQNKGTGQKKSLKTNEKGEYFSIGVAPGDYKITLTINGNPRWAGESHIGLEDFVFDMDLKALAGEATPESRAAIEEAKKKNELAKNLNAKIEAGMAAEKAQDWQTAASAFREVISVDATKPGVWSHLADAEAKMKNYPAAIEAYEKAIAIYETQPKQPTGVPGQPAQNAGAALASVYNNLGDAYGRSGNSEKAVELFTKAATTDPASAGRYYFNLGAVMFNSSKFQEAFDAFKKSTEIDPTNARAQYLLGQTGLNLATMQGDKMVVPEGTTEAYQSYLELEPTGPQAEEVKQTLTAIGAPLTLEVGKRRNLKKKN